MESPLRISYSVPLFSSKTGRETFFLIPRVHGSVDVFLQKGEAVSSVVLLGYLLPQSVACPNSLDEPLTKKPFYYPVAPRSGNLSPSATVTYFFGSTDPLLPGNPRLFQDIQ